jgi:hypothetical protein
MSKKLIARLKHISIVPLAFVLGRNQLMYASETAAGNLDAFTDLAVEALANKSL